MRLIDADEAKKLERMLTLKPSERALFRLMLDRMPTYDPPNDPLTMEELREMGGEPYWHVGLQKDSPPPHWNILDPLYAQHIEDYGFGKRWLAYRRKVESTR